MKRVCAIMIWLGYGLYSGGWMQAQDYRVDINTQELRTDGEVQVRLEVAAGMLDEAPLFPEAAGLEKGRLQSTPFIREGRAQEVYVQTYYPLGPGEFQLPGFEPAPGMVVPPYSIKVTGAALERYLEPVPVEGRWTLVVRPETVFVGQPVLVSIGLTLPLQSESTGAYEWRTDAYQAIERTWTLTGTWKEPLLDPAEGWPAVRQDSLGTHLVFYRVLLFPLSDGTWALPETRIPVFRVWRLIDAGAYLRQTGRHLRFRPDTVILPGPSLYVRPLPETGLQRAHSVGVFRGSSVLSKGKLRTGEALTMELRVDGNGNMALVPEPFFSWPPSFEVTAPRSEYEMVGSDGELKGEKRFIYEFVPYLRGTYDLGPFRMYYFHPETESYDTLRWGPVRVEVVGRERESGTGRGYRRDIYDHKLYAGEGYESRESLPWGIGFGVGTLAAICIILWGVFKRRHIFSGSKE